MWLTAKRTIFDVKNLAKRPANKANEEPQFSDLFSLFGLCWGSWRLLIVKYPAVPIPTTTLKCLLSN